MQSTCLLGQQARVESLEELIGKLRAALRMNAGMVMCLSSAITDVEGVQLCTPESKHPPPAFNPFPHAEAENMKNYDPGCPFPHLQLEHPSWGLLLALLAVSSLCTLNFLAPSLQVSCLVAALGDPWTLGRESSWELPGSQAVVLVRLREQATFSRPFWMMDLVQGFVCSRNIRQDEPVIHLRKGTIPPWCSWKDVVNGQGKEWNPCCPPMLQISLSPTKSREG